MTKSKQKLELTWIGKENRPKLEPRILLEDPDKSYHAPGVTTRPIMLRPMVANRGNILWCRMM
ncbi:MAG: hypothetical protein DRH06_05920 [Deltaproteobacteria bacterium]|nr:MAG: hypothetical protein DRH07_01710 [Deltaproteobacteria bacterium]RLB76448.1 MAG: hypothetical protein DRH06_05920 [Deltaproteobacteria bacterium]